MPAAMEATEPPPPQAAPSAWVLSVKCRLEEAGVSETRLLLLRRAHLDELHCKLGWLFNLQGRYQLKYLDKFGDLITFSTDEEFQLALSNFLRPEFRILVTPAGEATTRPARRQWSSRPPPPPPPLNSKSAAAPTAAPAASASAAAAETTVLNNRVATMSDDASVWSAAEKPSVHQNRKPAAAASDRRRAVFRPDYLRPRTATQRQSASAAPGVQAALAGYRQNLATRDGSDGASFVHFGIGCSRCGADPLIGWRFKCSLCPNYNMCAGCFDSYSHGHGFYRLP